MQARTALLSSTQKEAGLPVSNAYKTFRAPEQDEAPDKLQQDGKGHEHKLACKRGPSAEREVAFARRALMGEPCSRDISTSLTVSSASAYPPAWLDAAQGRSAFVEQGDASTWVPSDACYNCSMPAKGCREQCAISTIEQKLQSSFQLCRPEHSRQQYESCSTHQCRPPFLQGQQPERCRQWHRSVSAAKPPALPRLAPAVAKISFGQRNFLLAWPKKEQM